MKTTKTARPVARRIRLADLIDRPDRATVQPPRVRRTLAEQIARHGCYPPLIVRRHPSEAGKYEILDGHHRAEILRRLGHTSARCEVWPVGEDDAELAAATLNPLRGRQDARRAAARARRLVRHYGRDAAAARLGLTPRALRQRLLAGRRPRRREPPALDLHAVVFHLPWADLDRLEQTLRAVGAGTLPRGQALLRAIGGRSDGGTDALPA